jgi:hypothetical protein
MAVASNAQKRLEQQTSPYVYGVPLTFDFGQLKDEHKLKRITLREQSTQQGASRPLKSVFQWQLSIETAKSCSLYSELGANNFIVCKFARSLKAGDIESVLSRHMTVIVNERQYKYRFFGHSASQLRERECVLYNETNLGERSKIQDRFGDFRSIRPDHKRAARIGMLLSSAESKVWLDESSIIKIDDVKRNGYNFTDGCGKVSFQTAEELTEALGIGHLYVHQEPKVPSVFQIRFKGCKGVLALDQEVPHGIQIRPSLVKFEWHLHKGQSHPLRIVENGYSKPNETGRINKQFIQLLSSLGIPDEVFEKKQWEHLRNVEQLLINQEVAMLYLSAFGQFSLTEKLLETGITGVVEQYLKKMKRDIKRGNTVETSDQKPRSKAEKLQIPIAQSRLVFGICDPSNCLLYGQCFFQPTIRGRPKVLVETKVLVGRNPSHHPGDMRVLECVDVPKCHHLVDCIVFPVQGDRPHADEMSGGDLDGDKFFVCWDQELVPHKTEEPCSYKFTQKRRQLGSPFRDPMVSLFAQYDHRILGYVDRLFNEWADARGAGSGECKCLSDLSSKAVDAAKTGDKVDIPKALRHPPKAVHGNFIWQKMEDKAKLFVQDQLMNDLGSVEMKEISIERMSNVLSDLMGTMPDYWLFRLAWKWWKATSTPVSQFKCLLEYIDFSNMTLEQRQLAMLDLIPEQASTPIIPQLVVFNALYSSAIFNEEDLAYFYLDKFGSGWRCLKSLSAQSLTAPVMTSLLQYPHPKLLVFEFQLGGVHWGLGLFLSGYFPFDSQEKNVVSFGDSKDCRMVTFLAIHAEEPTRETCCIPDSYSLLWENGIFQLYEGKRTQTFVFMDVREGQPMASVALNRFRSGVKDRAPTKLRREFSVSLEVYAWTNEDEQLLDLIFSSETRDDEEVGTGTTSAAVKVSDFSILERDFPPLGVDEKYVRTKETEMDEKIHEITQLLSAESLTAQPLEGLVAMTQTFSKDEAAVLASHVEHFLFESNVVLSSSDQYLTLILCLLHYSGLTTYQETEPLFRLEKWANNGRVRRLLWGMQQHDVAFTVEELDNLLQHILYACNVTVAQDILDMLYTGHIPLCCHSGCPFALEYYRKWVAVLAVEMVEEIACSRAQSNSALVTLFDDESHHRYDVHIQTPHFVVNHGDALVLSPVSGSMNEYFILQVTQPGDRIISATQVWPAGERDGTTHPENGEWRVRCQSGTVTYQRAVEALRTVLYYDFQTGLPSPVYTTVLQNGIKSVAKTAPDQRGDQDSIDIATSENTRLNDGPKPDPVIRFEFDKFKENVAVPVTLIQGPPGTGKTLTSAHIVSHWYDICQQPVLVTAETNEGVDNLIEKIIEVGFIPRDKLVRLGRDDKIKDRSYEYSFEKKYEEKVKRQRKNELDREIAKKIIDGARVVCTTCTGAGSALLKDKKFTRVLVDEACQATEPATLIPMVYGCSELVLVGDDKQLPPLVKSERASELRISLFERLACAGIPVHLLDTQYRMHPVIAEYPSRVFYSSRLKNGVTESDRPVPRGFPWPRHRSPLAFVHVEGRETSSRSSKKNDTEAEKVCQIVQSLIRAGEVSQEQVGVVTPYKAQEARIKDGLSRTTGCSAVSVKTVDGFQGQERDVIVFSAVRSNYDGNIGFLADQSRFNVTLTRAKRGLIVVGNGKTLSGNGKTLSGNSPDNERNIWSRWLEWMRNKGCRIEGGKVGRESSSVREFGTVASRSYRGRGYVRQDKNRRGRGRFD